MRSWKAASGSSTGVIAKLAPSVFGVHLSIMMPFGTSMNDKRIGRVVSAAWPSAGIIASRSGRVSAAPAPRRNARRWIAFLCITIAHTPHLEWRAFDDAEDHDGPAVLVSRRIAHDLAHGRAVIRLDAAAERVSEQPLGERVEEQVLFAEQHFAQAARAVEGSAVGQHTGGIDRTRTDGVAPAAQAVEILQREAERVH